MREILISAGISLAIISVGPRLGNKMFYDDRPALVVWNMKPTNTKLTPDEAYVYTFNYTKRVECYPPKGAGEVTHRLWETDEGVGFARFTVINNSISFAQPAVNGFRKSVIQLPTLRPGHYAVQWRVEFKCSGASNPQEMIGPLMEFDVVEKWRADTRPQD